jgi:LuxR family maltose regulon positive regulatory protein
MAVTRAAPRVTASAGYAGGPGPPAARDRLVPRTSLVDRLLRSEQPVVTVVAPPGYGKTTLLEQWAGRLGPRVAWVSCDRSHDDPAALLRGLLAALDRIEPVPQPLDRLLAASGGDLGVVPRIATAMGTLPPVTVVLDNFETVTSSRSTSVVTELALRVPPGWRLALASRVGLPLPTSRLRVDRRIVELEAHDLAMTRDEAAALLRLAGARVTDEQAAELWRHTEGWPAGLYLAALAIRSGAPPTAVGFRGDDRLVADYLRSEVLARMSRAQTRFLTRTSILERVSGPLCDAVAGRSRSGRMLQELARQNRLVIALDRRGEWYRYHPLLRELLQADLARDHPDRLRELHVRAADWFEAHGMAEAAIEHADAAGETRRLARLVLELMQPVWASGRVDTVRGWMERLDRRPRVPYFGAVAAHAALIFALLGRPAEAERWIGVAESLPAAGVLPDGNTVAGTLAYLRAILCRDGPAAMREDADLALQGLSPASPYRATVVHSQALAWLLEGQTERAETLFADAYDLALGFGATPLAAMVLAQQSLLASARGDDAAAGAALARAVELVDANHVEGYWTSALVFAAAAHAAARRGHGDLAHELVGRAAALRPLLTHALPVVSVQALLELTGAYLALGDAAGAKATLAQAHGILRRRPALGGLAAAAREHQARVDRMTATPLVGASALTTAELRLLPLLPTHLSLPEIAGRLFVSPHTVRSQVKSVYRKLGVSSRSEVVELMAEAPEPR